MSREVTRTFLKKVSVFLFVRPQEPVIYRGVFGSWWPPFWFWSPVRSLVSSLPRSPMIRFPIDTPLFGNILQVSAEIYSLKLHSHLHNYPKGYDSCLVLLSKYLIKSIHCWIRVHVLLKIIVLKSNSRKSKESTRGSIILIQLAKLLFISLSSFNFGILFFIK